jgi:sugar phosphate isomerase/epimerase
MTGKLAVQMFTVREFTQTAADLAKTLQKVRAIGYPAVQLSAVGCMNGATPEVSAKQARRMLDDAGLRCIATHRGWEALAQQTEAEIAFHQELGCDFAAIGGIPQNYRDGAAGFRRFVQDARPTIAKLKAAGIRFGYHNHAFEFVRIGPGQKTTYDIFVDEAYPDFMLEVDTYWAIHAGVNPERLFARAAGRVPVIHLKDKAVVEGNDARFAPIGEGNLDWAHILPACRKAGVEWYAIEQDNCFGRDPFDCLKASFDFLATQGA